MASREINWEHLPLRRVPAQERSRDKVARALVAADQIVRSEGPDGVNLPRVAELAGISVGALYQYLPDRDAIVKALVWRYHARLEALLDEAVDAARRQPPQSDPVDYMIDAVAQIYREEESVRSLRASADQAALTEESRAHKQRMAVKVGHLLAVAGGTQGRTAAPSGDQSPEPSGDQVATVAFIAADAILHEAFSVAEPQRGLMIAELRRLISCYVQFR